MEMRRVSLARYAESTDGRWGGMEFHAARYVSLTLSRLSSMSARMLQAILVR